MHWKKPRPAELGLIEPANDTNSKNAPIAMVANAIAQRSQYVFGRRAAIRNSRSTIGRKFIRARLHFYPNRGVHAASILHETKPLESPATPVRAR
jgi:hypothetical protein